MRNLLSENLYLYKKTTQLISKRHHHLSLDQSFLRSRYQPDLCHM